ncbi:hypothetical protein BVRB_018880, partial [Beta vulgaris subsp. vulgaris]
DSSFEGR